MATQYDGVGEPPRRGGVLAGRPKYIQPKSETVNNACK